MATRLPAWTLVVPLVLGSLSVGSSAQPPGAGGPSVTVVNTAANPVPVTGSITGSVTGAVTISGTPTVQINNSPAAPLFVEPATTSAREPIFVRVDKTSSGIGLDYTVPADKIFVIESVNIQALIDDSVDHDIVGIRIRPPGEDAINASTIQFVPVLLEPYGSMTIVGGEDAFRAAASLTTRLYAGPSHELLLEAPRVGSSVTQAVIVISGYLVPATTSTLAP